MKRYLITMLLLSVHCMLFAASSVLIKGKVVDAVSNEAVDYADVIVTDLNDKIVASGIVTNGSFTIEKVPAGEILVVVRMMGYDPFISEKLIVADGQTLDLGTIQLHELATGLSEVTVVGEKNQIVYKLDRKRINGSSSVTASGGTAVDILANTPSVQVDPMPRAASIAAASKGR